MDADFGGYRVFVYFLSVSSAIVSRALLFNVSAVATRMGEFFMYLHLLLFLLSLSHQVKGA